jgi:aminomethyltransferase
MGRRAGRASPFDFFPEPAVPRQTPLYALHRAAGARMVDFGGWDMPVNYGSQIDEHHAVRGDAGMFDVSHMRAVDLEGEGARDFLRHVLANNVDKLTAPGKALYSCLLRPDGGVLDDLIVYFLREDFFRLVVNAGTADKDIAWLRELMKARSPQLRLTPRDDLAMIAVQGPQARAKVWQALPGSEASSSGLKPFFGIEAPLPGGHCFIARTGYTGEDGFEIYTTDPDPGIIWATLIEKGTPLGLLPIGLGARDTLRLESKLMLYGNDISDKTTVLEADLKWIVKLQKGAFLGRPVIEKQLAEGLKRKLVGFELAEPGVARPHYPVYVKGQKVSEVASGTFSPLLKKAIGLVYLPIEATAVGTEFEIEIRTKRTKARVIPTPFYKRADKK